MRGWVNKENTVGAPGASAFQGGQEWHISGLSGKDLVLWSRGSL